MNRVIFMTGLCIIFWGGDGAQKSLEDVELVLTDVADSSGYFVYSYEVRNPATSTWGVAMVKVGIGASDGAPSNLAVTGELYDATSRIAGEQSAAHAEVGPITPAGWIAALSRRAELWWYAPSQSRMSQDSVAPNSVKAGFGLRSSYLPGITWTISEPTRQSCCAVPDSIEGIAYYHSSDEYPSHGFSVAPRYQRKEVELDTLSGLLGRVCSAPLWIDDVPVCEEMGDSIDMARARLAINNYEGAALATLGVGNLADDNRTMWGGEVTDNAYWLLKVNSDFIADTLMADMPPIAYADLCAKGPENTSVHFSLSASGGELLEGSPLLIDAYQEGDPSGTGCETVWRIAWADTAVVDLSIKADSVTPGHSVSQIWVQGGMDGDTTLTARDSVLTRHDGITGAFILFELAPSP